MKTVPTSIAVLALLAVSGCAAGSKAAVAPANSSTALAGAQGQARQQRMPGVTGLLAAVDGTTLQVQDTTSQTAVVFTAKTVITQTVAAKRADLTVGSCVAVVSNQTAAGAPAAGGGSPAAPVTASTVTMSAQVNGSCAAGLGRRGGPDGTPSSGRPRFVRPSGSPRPGGGFRGAFGKVIAITPTGFTVVTTGFVRQGATATATRAPIVVVTTAATTYAKQRKASASDLKVGLCVTARGPEDGSGAVTASSLALRASVNGSCASGFGPRNG